MTAAEIDLSVRCPHTPEQRVGKATLDAAKAGA